MPRIARSILVLCVLAVAHAITLRAQIQPVGPIQQRPVSPVPVSPTPARPVPVISDAPLAEAAPGIPLPPYGTVWILDTGGEKARLVRMRPSDALPDRHLAKNIARNEAMVLKNVSSLDLAGAASAVRLAGHATAIFVRKAGPATQMVQPIGGGISIASHYVLLRTRQFDDRRQLCSFTFWRFGGKRARHEDDVESSVEEIAGGRWLKLTPKEPLPDGEYAVVDMPEDPTRASASAYDFGVGPAALKPKKDP